jgi:hypothetical protein
MVACVYTSTNPRHLEFHIAYRFASAQRATFGTINNWGQSKLIFNFTLTLVIQKFYHHKLELNSIILVGFLVINCLQLRLVTLPLGPWLMIVSLDFLKDVRNFGQQRLMLPVVNLLFSAFRFYFNIRRDILILSS